ncbi:hypothetical protein D1Y84_07840 [Acidipila sp. EB88]|nr:hypothetical protein D1Y84_07840 [Acidipila sp. EB88]
MHTPCSNPRTRTMPRKAPAPVTQAASLLRLGGLKDLAVKICASPQQQGRASHPALAVAAIPGSMHHPVS